jgi:hypothetical protein
MYKVNTMKQGPPWEAYRFSASPEIARTLWNPKVHYRVYKARHLSLSEPDKFRPCSSTTLSKDPY